MSAIAGHSTGRPLARSSFLGHPGAPFTPQWRLELLAAVAIVVALHLAGVELAREDGVALGFIQFIIAGVVEAFRWLGNQAVTIATVVWHATRIVGSSLVRFATGLGGILGKVYGLLRDFWSGVLKPFVNFVWRNIERVHTWLKTTLGPAFKFVEMLRRRLLEIYDRYFRPIFDTIELVRRTLQLLSVFRLEWARELDRKLAEIEDRLLWPIREAMFRLNQVSDWLNRVIGLDGLFQRVTLIRSLMKYHRDATAIWWRSVHRPLVGEKRAEYQRPMETTPIAVAATDYRAYVADRSGPSAARINEHARDYAIRLRGLVTKA